MLTFSQDSQLKNAKQHLRMQGHPWGNCSSLLCGLTVHHGIRVQRSAGVHHSASMHHTACAHRSACQHHGGLFQHSEGVQHNVCVHHGACVHHSACVHHDDDDDRRQRPSLRRVFEMYKALIGKPIDSLIFLPAWSGGPGRSHASNLTMVFGMHKVSIDSPTEALIVPPSWAPRPRNEPEIESERGVRHARSFYCKPDRFVDMSSLLGEDPSASSTRQ